MIGVAALAQARGRLDDARRLLDAVDAMLASIGAAMKSSEERVYTRTRDALATEAAEDGAALSEADAIDLARTIAASG